MYNHGPGSCAGGSGLLSLPLPQGENSTTPRTPEILNSLIAMSNPFDSSYRAHAPRLASSPPGGSDTSTSSSGSPGCTSPPSVQHTRSQLIKEGLKLTIQSKRRGGDGLDTDDVKLPRADDTSRLSVSGDDQSWDGDGLTPEDEERRRRRRERNKIAATKCRLKKRERTVNLVHESEILENQNHDLKSQIQELETQRRRLMDMLSVHRTSCTKSQQVFSTEENSYSSNYQAQTYSNTRTGGGMEFRRMNASSFPRNNSSLVDTTVTYRRVEMSTVSCADNYPRIEPVVETDSFCRTAIDPTVYHNYDQPEMKDSPHPVPYCRPSVNSVETPPQFTRIGDQYLCQNMNNPDPFVKPELPPMAGFHSPASSYGRPTSLDICSVSPGYDGVNSPSLAATTYQPFDEESDSFSSGFSSSALDRNCIS